MQAAKAVRGDQRGRTDPASGAAVSPRTGAMEGAHDDPARCYSRELSGDGKRRSAAARLPGGPVGLYPAVAGALYALLAGTVRIPSVAGGVVLGVVVWIVGPGWLLPRLKPSSDGGTSDGAVRGLEVAAHLAYGVVTAGVFNLISRGGRRLKEIELEIEFADDEDEEDKEQEDEMADEKADASAKQE